MRTNELQIGDWVLCDMNAQSDYEFDTVNYQPFQIKTGEDIDYACERNMCGDADVYQPIPLTAEILEKNGWQKVIGENPVEVWSIRNGVYLHHTDNGYKLREGAEFNIPNIQYVHELQRALRCCGLWDLANNFVV